jgi:gingipain R
MTRAILIVVIMNLVGLAANAAERVVLATSEEDVSVSVLQSTGSETILQFQVNAFEREPVGIEGQSSYLLTCGREGVRLNAGEPALPYISRSLIISDDLDVTVDVLGAEYQDLAGYPVAPSKGNLLRTVNPDDVPYAFGPVYQTDQPYPGELASVREPYILRDFRGTVVLLNAFQYLPRQQALRVYTSVTLAVRETSNSQTNTLQRTQPLTKIDPGFDQLYRRHFLNYGAGNPLLYTPVLEDGEMLVITYDNFHAAIQPFVNWKIQKGILTTLVDVSIIGNNSTAIRNYIQAFYNNTTGNLAYVLLVGDAAQVATPTASGGSSDPTYAKVVGSDNYPDIFVGRFSAETVAHVQTQVERSVEYERDAQADAWYHLGTGIASDQGPGDDGEYDYQHMNNIRTDLLGYTYTSVDQIYDPGATAAQVTAALNPGRSIVDYCGHGSATSWGTTGFSNGNVAALTNDNKLPFIFSVACVNGQFSGLTCFAEAWLRSTHNGNPIGALATYMSSINQSWNPPMDAQDEFIDLLRVESKTTFGGLCFNAACHMIDVYGADGANMYNTWHVFGDPSVQVRTNTPVPMNVSHAGDINIGAPTFDVSVAGVSGAQCALAYNGVLYGAAYTNASGQAVIPITGLLPPGQNIMLTITALNKLTVVDSVAVISGPASLSVSSPNGGEIWYFGDAATISWSSTNVFENLVIEINRNYPAGAWELITQSAPNSGSFPWSVTAPAANHARIRMTGAVNPTTCDSSDADFTIVERSLSLISPDGGESWPVGENHPIQWTTQNVTENVKIELNRGYPIGVWETIASSVSNTGVFPWVVSEPATDEARIRVTCQVHTLVGDQSDASFYVLPPNVPPAIAHDPLHDQTPVPFTVTAMVTDDYGTPVTYFHYWPVSGGAGDSVLMTATGNPYEFAAAVGALQPNVYGYFLRATDMSLSSAVTANSFFTVGENCGTELGYDDGTAEASHWAQGTEFKWAVKFDPDQLPYALCSARIGISAHSPERSHSPIVVEVLNADGPGGLPGSLILTRVAGSIGNVIGGVPLDQDNWDYVVFRDGLGNPLVLTAPFYLAVSNPATTCHEAFLHDMSSAPAGQSFVYDGCEEVWLNELAQDSAARPGNRMIRAQGFSLVPPTVVVHRQGDHIQLFWENLRAPQYIILSGNAPSGPFDVLEGSTADTTFVDTDAVITSPRKFYIVQCAAQ